MEIEDGDGYNTVDVLNAHVKCLTLGELGVEGPSKRSWALCAGGCGLQAWGGVGVRRWRLTAAARGVAGPPSLPPELPLCASLGARTSLGLAGG